MSKKTVFVIKAFIFNEEGKFLTIRRTETAPSQALKWDLPGGKIEFGETAEEGIKREIKEETNFLVKDLKIIGLESYLSEETGNYKIFALYLAKYSSGKFKVSYEHDLYKWVTPEEYLKLKTPPILRKFAKLLVK